MSELCPNCESAEVLPVNRSNFAAEGISGYGQSEVDWDKFSVKIYDEPVETPWYESVLVPVIGTVIAGVILYYLTRK